MSGKTQARALADFLRRDGSLGDCGVFLTSPLPRAAETAEILAAVLELPAVRPEIALCEMGDLPAGSAGGETLVDFLERVGLTMHDLAERYRDQTVMAVTHAGFIMASIRVLFDMPTPGIRARLDPTYCSLTGWTFGDGIWRLERYNVAS